MDDETRAAFGRMDRYFELSHAQHQGLRKNMDREFAEMRADFGSLRVETGSLREQVGSLRDEVGSLRNEFGSLREEFRSFRDWVVEQFALLRGEVRQFTARLERVERR